MTPTITVNTYSTWVRQRLGDPSFDATTLIQLANDTNRFICNSFPWPFMERTFNGTVTSTNNTYALPTGCQTPVSMTLNSPTTAAGPLTYVPFINFDEAYPAPASMTKGTPSIWTLFGSSFIVGPSYPDTTYTIALRYVASPTAITLGTAIPDLPDDFSELMTLGMYVRALEINDQFTEAQVKQQEFDIQLGNMRDRLLRRKFGRPRKLRTGRQSDASS